MTYIEYSHDPDPEDTMIESIVFFLIHDRDGLRIEPDRHVTGLFPRATWLRLLDEAGFDVEQRSFRLEAMERPYELLVGVLREGY
ncbi:MAG TPA: hypothetical protein VM658_10265 [bacterium]|nr:hypothetical protein [bacterium]